VDPEEAGAIWSAWQPQSNATNRLAPPTNSIELRDPGDLVIRGMRK